MFSYSSSTHLAGAKLSTYIADCMRKLNIYEEFCALIFPQLMRITEENKSNHKSNFTGDSTYMQKDMGSEM